MQTTRPQASRGDARGAERQHARRAPTFCCLASSTRRDACGAIMVKAPLLCTRGGAVGTGALSPPGRRHAGSSRLPPEEPFSSPFLCAPLSRCMDLVDRSKFVCEGAHELACSTLSLESVLGRGGMPRGQRGGARGPTQVCRGPEDPRAPRGSRACAALRALTRARTHTHHPRVSGTG